MRTISESELAGLLESASGRPSLTHRAELLASLTARIDAGAADVDAAPMPLRAFTGSRALATPRRVGAGLGLGAWAALAVGSAAAAGTWAALAANEPTASERPPAVSAVADIAGSPAAAAPSRPGPPLPGAGTGADAPDVLPSLTAPRAPGVEVGLPGLEGGLGGLPQIDVVVDPGAGPVAGVGVAEGDVVVELTWGTVVGGPLGEASCGTLAEPVLGVVDLGALLCGR